MENRHLVVYLLRWYRSRLGPLNSWWMTCVIYFRLVSDANLAFQIWLPHIELGIAAEASSVVLLVRSANEFNPIDVLFWNLEHVVNKNTTADVMRIGFAFCESFWSFRWPRVANLPACSYTTDPRGLRESARSAASSQSISSTISGFDLLLSFFGTLLLYGAKLHRQNKSRI